MEIKAQEKYIRITPRKARLVARAISHLPLERMLLVLDKIQKKAAFYIKATIESAIANAQQANIKRENLSIKKLVVDEGPRLKRWRAASRGSAHPYTKRTSHITVILEEKQGTISSIAKKSKKSQTKRKVKSLEKNTKKVQKGSLHTYKVKLEKGNKKTPQTQAKPKTGLIRKVIGG